MGAAMMHTGYYFGFLFAAIGNYFIGSHFGWRYMFVLGGAPALFLAYLRSQVKEPVRWKNKLEQLGDRLTMRRSFLELFSSRYRRRTIFNSTYMIVSLVGLWGGAVYVPSAVTYLAGRSGMAAAEAARLASYSTALLGVATVLTALIVPFLADRIGRRATLATLFAFMGVFILVAFGHVFYMVSNAVAWFMVCTVFLGIGGANFIVYSFWLPEQYGTECRASAFAFTANIGRFAAAGFTFLVGAGIHHFHTLGTPVAATATVFLVGILLLPFGEETRGKRLPA